MSRHVKRLSHATELNKSRKRFLAWSGDEQYFSLLWKYLMFSSSKYQSTTTVLFKITLTETTTLYEMLMSRQFSTMDMTTNYTICSLIIRLAPRAGKMIQIARCDWLPERARWSHLARSGLPAISRKKNFPESHIINPLLTKFVWTRWLDIGLVPRSKKNLATIQPFWPHTCSITHIY